MAKIPRCEIHNSPIWPKKGCRGCAALKVPWILISTDGYTEIAKETEYPCSPLSAFFQISDDPFICELLVAVGEQNKEQVCFSRMVAVTGPLLNTTLEMPMYNLMGLYIPKGSRVSMKLRDCNKIISVKVRLAVTEWLENGFFRSRFLQNGEGL